MGLGRDAHPSGVAQGVLQHAPATLLYKCRGTVHMMALSKHCALSLYTFFFYTFRQPVR